MAKRLRPLRKPFEPTAARSHAARNELSPFPRRSYHETPDRARRDRTPVCLNIRRQRKRLHKRRRCWRCRWPLRRSWRVGARPRLLLRPPPREPTGKATTGAAAESLKRAGKDVKFPERATVTLIRHLLG